MVKLNRRVTVIVPGFTKNDYGGNVATEVTSWEKWANVEDRTGSNSNPYQQQVWDYDYKITMRRERTRPTKSNYEIEYNGARLKINSVSINTESFQQLEILRCSVVEEQS